MCGFAGIISHGWAQRPEAFRDLLHRMAASLDHRGPDERGTLVAGPVGLAFARLSIIDLAGSHQPMATEDGLLSIVFNGEIYNFPKLRKELQALGSRFRTRGDTEVLLEAYRHWGVDMLQRLNGMFALAIHDRRTGELFLARDRLGIKPLYYARHGEDFVFGSEIKALRQVPGVGGELDPVALDRFLRFSWIPAPLTIHPDISALPPAHCLTVSASSEGPKRYWSLDPEREVELDEDAALDRLKELLIDSVTLRRIAEVPLGAFLSSGIDSGLVVAALARSSARPVATFSVGFDEEATSELPGARAVAQMYGTDHHEIHCADRIDELVEEVFPRYDQPFADTSALPTFLICREARRHVTVVLSGDGGDEGFGGYERHFPFAGRRSEDLGNPFVHRMAGALACRLDPLIPGRNRLRRMGLDAFPAALDRLTILDGIFRSRLAGPRLRNHVTDAFGTLTPEVRQLGEVSDALRLIQLTDLHLFLPNDILEKVDKASMMNSLEVRVPFLDHRLVEFGLSLPHHLKNDGHMGKKLLRQLAAEWLPPTHHQRPKTGFGIPRDRWLRTVLREPMMDNLGKSRAAEDGWLDQSYLDRLIVRHLAGRSYGPALWSLLIFEIWYRRNR